MAVAVPGAAEEMVLRAGVARADITPGESMPMYGYANRKCGPANGTHDRLWAKALVLETGESRVAIVTLDLGSIVSEAVPRRAAAELGIPLVLLAASHSHSTPAYLGATPAPGYQAEMEGKVLGAIREAAGALFPARLAASRGSLQLGYNRLLPREDGRSRALFENPERIPYGPVDPEYVLLRVDDAQGVPRALLVHYAVHPVVLGPTNCKYSADYPGVLQERLEAEMPGLQAMFVQGAAGDINPLFLARTTSDEENFRMVAKMGELLAAAVLRDARRAAPLGPHRQPIAFRREVATFEDRWEKGRPVEVGLATVLLHQDVAVAAHPGEPLHKLQKLWKENAEAPVALYYGYTYSGAGIWPGYIPDLRSAAHGGYGAEASTRIEVGAGERIIQRHLIHLYDLQGQWRDKPGRP